MTREERVAAWGLALLLAFLLGLNWPVPSDVVDVLAGLP